MEVCWKWCMHLLCGHEVWGEVGGFISNQRAESYGNKTSMSIFHLLQWRGTPCRLSPQVQFLPPVFVLHSLVWDKEFKRKNKWKYKPNPRHTWTEELGGLQDCKELDTTERLTHSHSPWLCGDVVLLKGYMSGRGEMMASELTRIKESLFFFIFLAFVFFNGLQDVNSSTRDWTWAPGSETAES